MLPNFLKMNDWPIKKFVIAILSIQLALWGLTGINTLGLQIPIIEQLIGTIYLIFIPGIILLRILKLHKLSDIETLLYSVGLSIALLMFTGFFMTKCYPLFGISNPMSSSYQVFTISIIVLTLCALSYVRDKDFYDFTDINLNEILSAPTLFLFLLLFLSIFGIYFMDLSNNNYILMIFIFLIAILAIFIGYDFFIPTKLFPFAVFLISLSLLYHTSLKSMYIWGWDIHQEYFFANLVNKTSIWDSNIPNNINGMLSVVILAPIFSTFCNLSITWVLKIIYPILFSFVPLGLYHIFKIQTNDKIAFLSCFFFMSLFAFYFWLVVLPRQQIAELFLVLIVMLIINKDLNSMKKSFLLVVFSFALVVSHYGLTSLYALYLISLFLLPSLLKNHKINKKIEKLIGIFYLKENDNTSTFSNIEVKTLSLNYVLLFAVISFSWYMYISNFHTFNTFIKLGRLIVENSINDFLNPKYSDGANLIISETVSPLHSINKYLYLITQLFISIGLFTSLIRSKSIKFEINYIALSLSNYLLLLASIILPYFARSITTQRMYQITLIFLAPFCLIGFVNFFKILALFSKSSINYRPSSLIKIFSIFLAIYLLFNTGFIYEITNDYPSSVSLNNTVSCPHFEEKEDLCANWISNFKSNQFIYADLDRVLILNGYEYGRVRYLTANIHEILTHSYIYVSSYNLQSGKFIISNNSPEAEIDSKNIIDNNNKIYDNQGSQIILLR